MKVVVNRCYGGFGLNDWAKNRLQLMGWELNTRSFRLNAQLVELVEKAGWQRVGGPRSKLEVKEIPDEATDWTLSDYDGLETIIYVVDGKLHMI